MPADISFEFEEDFVFDVFQDGKKNVFLGFEVVKDRASGGSGHGGNFRHGSFLEAFVREQACRSL
jgi:hypothetical protein